VSQNKHVRSLYITVPDNEITEEIANPQILPWTGVDQIEIYRLKKQPAINDVARPDIVPVTLNPVRPHGVQLDIYRHRLFVAPDVELHLIALEFSLDHFRKFDALAFQFHIRIARDRVIIHRQQHVALAKNFRARSRRHHGGYEHPAIVIFQAEDFSL